MDLEKHRQEASVQSLGSSSDKIINAILDEFKSLNIDKSAKIIDVGCGQGELLKHVKALGFENIYGTDYSDFGANDQFEFFQHDSNKPFPEQYRDFDVILCSEVIEHIENPWAFTRNLRTLGKTGCHLILSTPNPESLLSIMCLIFKGHFVAFGPKDYPAHITPVSIYEITNMFALLNTSRCEFSFVRNGRIPGTGMLWHDLLPGLQGKRFSENYIVKNTFL